MDALISPLAIAPMIDWTTSPFRILMRLLAPKALLYTEMQTIGAVKNNASRALFFTIKEQPLALQLGGADLDGLVTCAKLAQDRGFAEVNLNLGCPSDKVQAGRFGACLMHEPNHVACCISAMKKAVSIPVTAKTRIGIDDKDSYSFFLAFAHKLANAGCDKLIVHARKAWLHGLNPKQNRTIPPIHYDYAYKIKRDLPNMPVVVNGNIEHLDAIKYHMTQVNGIMVGRLACKNPYALASIHHYFYPNQPIGRRCDIIQDYFIYLIEQFQQGMSLSLLLKPIYTLAHGMPCAKQWKAQLTQAQHRKDLAPLIEAISLLR